MDQVKALSKSDLSMRRRICRVAKDARQTFRDDGLKGVVRRYGWKFFAVFFCYYLARDLFLYVALPWWVARHLTP